MLYQRQLNTFFQMPGQNNYAPNDFQWAGIGARVRCTPAGKDGIKPIGRVNRFHIGKFKVKNLAVKIIDRELFER